MNFEIQRACPRPGQPRVIASGPAAIKTLERLTTLLPNAKVSVETLTIPPETKKDEFGSMPDLRGPVPEIESDEDDDDIMHDPDIQEMVKNGEHTCHMFDAPCQACEDEEDEEEEEDEDDITLAELKEQLEDNMTLAELQDRLLAEEEEENYENYENYNEKVEEEPSPIEWVDEMTYHSRTCGELRNF